jgi:hypothetical protein
MRPSERPPRASEHPPRTERPARASERPPPPRSSANMPVARRASIPAPAAVGRIKGTAIRAGLTWYATTHGHDALARVRDRATPQLQTILQLGEPACGVIASGWYDVASIGELLDLLELVADPPDREEFTMLLTMAIARDNVNGIYKSLFKLVATPSMLVANSQRVWSTYVDEGTLVARAPTPGTLECEVRAWTHHHPAVCRVVGFMIQNILRAVGYNALVIERTQCVSDGDGLCAFEGMYLP